MKTHRRHRLASSLFWMGVATVEIFVGVIALALMFIGLILTQWAIAWWNNLWGWR
jgi:hypothetical protein